jgi:hypothetical protein
MYHFRRGFTLALNVVFFCAAHCYKIVKVLFCLLVLILSGVLAAQAQTEGPSITSATLAAPYNNGYLISYGGEGVQLDIAVNLNGSAEKNIRYQLWEKVGSDSWVQINAGSDALLVSFNSKQELISWFSNRSMPVPIGIYKYKIYVIDISKSSAVWSTPFQTRDVKVLAPRVAPVGTPAYFQFNSSLAPDLQDFEEQSDRYVYWGESQVFNFMWGPVSNDQGLPKDMVYEFSYRLSGDQNWTVKKVTTIGYAWSDRLGGEAKGLHDMETYEFAVRACNPYGCAPYKFLSKPIYFDYPEKSTSTLPGALHFRVIDHEKNTSLSQNYCLADPVTQICSASVVQVIADSNSFSKSGSVSLYKGSTLLRQNSGVMSANILENMYSLPVGNYSFVVSGSDGAEDLYLRRRFFVYVPAQGNITASECEISADADSCSADLKWEVSGSFPACLYSVSGNQKTNVKCVDGGSGEQTVSVQLGVKETHFEVSVNEPAGSRVLASAYVQATHEGVSFNVGPEICDIVPPQTSCIAHVSWNTLDFSPCLFKGTQKVVCSVSGSIDIAISGRETAFTLVNGETIDERMLARSIVRSRKVPVGSLSVAPGYSNPCVPTNGNACQVNIEMEHLGGATGVTLYKNEQAWANLGSSGDVESVKFTKSLSAEANGTRYSMRTNLDGEIYELASITLYPTTYTNEGYLLTSSQPECTFNPIYETKCTSKVEWEMPSADACIFLAGQKTGFCPDSTMLVGISGVPRPLGTHLYQLRKGNFPDAELVAQVAVVSKEEVVAFVEVGSSRSCNESTCDVKIKLFTNYTGNICLYDNGAKLEQFCNLNRSFSFSNYQVSRENHLFELVVEDRQLGEAKVIASDLFKPALLGSSSSSQMSSNFFSSATTSSPSSLVSLPTPPVITSSDVDEDCFFSLSLNASSSVSEELVYEIYEKKPSDFLWPERPTSLRSRGGISPNTPPFKLIRAEQSPGEYSYKSRICHRSAMNNCTEFSDVHSLRVKDTCGKFVIPVVDLWAPLNGQEYTMDEVVKVTATASIAEGDIASVSFYQDGNLVFIDNQSPYEYDWTPERLGSYHFMAQAEGTNGGTAITQWNKVNVVRLPAQPINPILLLASPRVKLESTFALGRSIPLQAIVYDQVMREWKNIGGQKPGIDFYANDVLLNAKKLESGDVYYWLPLAIGSYQIKAIAHLDEGKVIESKVGVINVRAPNPPSVEVNLSQSSLTAGDVLFLTAAVTDVDDQLEDVLFYANGQPISASDSVAPYDTRWVAIDAGKYTFTAEVMDKSGNKIRSLLRTITVSPRINSAGGIAELSNYGDAILQGLLWSPMVTADTLIVKKSNPSRISYNKLSHFLVRRPLKIINRGDMHDNGIVPQLIVIDADQIELNSSIEIVGEPADLLIVNTTGSNAIRCKSCGFINVERAALAVATPAAPFSSSMAQVGQLQTRMGGVIDIDNLQASGVVSLEVIADKVTAKGQITTQQYARQTTEPNPNTNEQEPVLDFVVTPTVDSVVVGSGGVSILQGNLAVNYETLELGATVAGAGVMDLQATISSGAINVFATDAIQLSGYLSTRSSHRAAQIYHGQLRAQEEQIQLKTIAQATTAPSLRIHGSVLSDAKVQMIGHSGDIKSGAGIRAAAVKAELIGQLLNQGYIHSYVRATAENPASDIIGIELGVGSLDNRGEIMDMFNDTTGEESVTFTHGEIKIASENNVYNRFGGLIKAKTIQVVSEKGKIRNGSLYAFDATEVGGKESSTIISIVRHDTSRLSTLNSLDFSLSKPPVANTTAVIVGDHVILDAAQSVENINPYTEPYTADSVEISTVSIAAEDHASDVQIEAIKKLSITGGTYVLNSSAQLGVSESRSENLLSIKAPVIRNERYFSNMIIETFSDREKVQEQTNIVINNWAKGVQSRYGFYSPPGYIYSFAKTEFNFGASGDGLVNNVSYVDLYGDLNVFGQGTITTRGISLEKLAYESGSTKIVSVSECAHYQGSITEQRGRTCSIPTSTYSRTPEGKLIKQSPDNTLFAVNGEISAPADFFNARNDQSLTVLRQEVIAQYKEETKKAAIDKQKASGTVYIDSRCDVSSYDKETESSIVIYQHFYSNDSNIKCFHQREYGEDRDPWKGDPPSTSDQVFAFTNITDLVNKRIELMGNTLDQQINDYRAWRKAAQATGN